MNDLAAALRTWLMRAPRPADLRVFCKDGREFDVTIAEGVAWSETAQNVAALEPERIEAMNKEGKLVRAVVVSDLVKKEAQVSQQAAATAAAIQSADPETQRMMVFANLIAQAHERATEAQTRTVEVAFTRMQEICDSLAQQANAATASANELCVAIRNMMIQHAQEAAEEATRPEGGATLETLAQNFLAGQTMAGASASNGVTNGKAHT